MQPTANSCRPCDSQARYPPLTRNDLLSSGSPGSATSFATTLRSSDAEELENQTCRHEKSHCYHLYESCEFWQHLFVPLAYFFCACAVRAAHLGALNSASHRGAARHVARARDLVFIRARAPRRCRMAPAREREKTSSPRWREHRKETCDTQSSNARRLHSPAHECQLKHGRRHDCTARIAAESFSHRARTFRTAGLSCVYRQAGGDARPNALRALPHAVRR